MNVYSKKDVTEYLSSNSIAPSKNRGQNFMTDENTASRIASVTPLARTSCALEIGGGLGALSEKIFDIYKENLTIVEYDKALYCHLKKRYENVIHSDILNFRLVHKSDVYGNIPYNIASPILDWLFVKNYGLWNYAVMMVQTDFARRALSKEGEKDYSSLSMFSKLMSEAKLEFHVSKNIFYPMPKIDSSVISFKPKIIDKCILPIYQKITRSLFHSRRKMAKNNLTKSPYMNLDVFFVSQMFEVLGIDEKARGEDIASDVVEKMARYIADVLNTPT